MKKRQRGLMLRFDRVLAHKLLKQLGILALLLIVSFALSYMFLSLSGAEWEQFCHDKGMRSKWLLPLYLLIDSNALNNLYFNTDGKDAVHGWMLFASSISFLLGAFIFNGMIISVMTTTISRRAEEHREGLIHYLQSGHYIIMGFDDMVTSVITYIFSKDKDAYILLLTSTEAVTVREKLKRTLHKNQLKKVIINYGHRTSTECYKDIHLEKAEQVYIVGYRGTPKHDAINVECVDSICQYLNSPKIKTHPQRIICVFEDLDTYTAFQTTDIFNQVSQLDIEFVPYNFYSGWAKQVFVKRYHSQLGAPEIKIEYPSVFKHCISKDNPRYVHLVFVGITRFSAAFAIEAAHILHLPYFDNDMENRRTRITFIDINADSEMEVFITRYRHFFEIQPYYYLDLTTASYEKNKMSKRINDRVIFEGIHSAFLDVEFEFIKGDVFSKTVQDLICEWADQQNKQSLSIFLAMADQRKNFGIGMNMPDQVYDNGVPIFIWQDRSDNFVTNLRIADSKKMVYTKMKDGRLQQAERLARYAHIYPFGMTDTGFCADDTSLWHAKLINFLYSTSNFKDGRFLSTERLDQMSKAELRTQVEEKWKGLTVALKWSSLYNAYTIHVKLACLREMRGLQENDTSRDTQELTEEELDVIGRLEHNRWSVEKLLMGYRKAHMDEDKYEESKKGNIENAEKLMQNKKLYIHHHIRPYDELDGSRLLDVEFSRYIPWMVKQLKQYDIILTK